MSYIIYLLHQVIFTLRNIYRLILASNFIHALLLLHVSPPEILLPFWALFWLMLIAFELYHSSPTTYVK